MIGRADDLTGAVVTIELEHERVHAGRTFQSSYKSPDASPVADDGTIDVLIKVTTIPIHFTFGANAGGNLEMAFYEAPTTTNDGTSLAVVALNRHRSIASTVTVFRDPTVSAVGDLLFNGFDSRGVGLLAPVTRELTEWVLRRNTNYLVRLINRAGGARDMSVGLQWYQALGGE